MGISPPRPILRAPALAAACLGLGAFWLAPAVSHAQPTQTPPRNAAVADVFAQLQRAYRREPIVERVDIVWRTPRGSQTSDALWVGVDAPALQAALALGELRVWTAQRDDRAVVYAAHVRDPMRVFTSAVRRSDLADALWSAVPSIPAPQIALAFADDPAAADLWPGLRSVRWRHAQVVDPDSPSTIELVGDAGDTRVALRVADPAEGAARLDSIDVHHSDGSRLTLAFTRLDAATTGAGAPLPSDPATWRLDVGPRRVVASLSQLAPLPPMQPPILFTSEGRPARFPMRAARDAGTSFAALILLDGDDAQGQRLAQLGQRLRADLLDVRVEADGKAGASDARAVDARIAIATNAQAERLVERLAHWRDWLGDEPLWTPGGAGRISQYAGGADVDALVLLTRDSRTTPILALRALDPLASPTRAKTLRAAVQRIARDALLRFRDDSERHER